jgi:hypothetical protein
VVWPWLLLLLLLVLLLPLLGPLHRVLERRLPSYRTVLSFSKPFFTGRRVA